MNDQPQQFVLQAPQTWQFRKAQSVPQPLAAAIREACEANRTIRACFIFDARKAENSEIKVLIALLVDDESRHLEQAVAHFQKVLSTFPTIAQNSAIMSAKRFEQEFGGTELYLRKEGRFNRLVRQFRTRI